MARSVLESRYLARAGGEIFMTRIVDCVPFTKIVNLPATASGVSTSAGLVVSGGVIVELDDALNSNAWTPNHVQITFVPVSASIYDTKIDASGYPFTGYGWVHPWGSTMQASSTFRGIHPDLTLVSGAGSYGWVAPLGIPIVIDVTADDSMKQLQLFNRFGGAVVAFINYTAKRIVNQAVKTETIICGD